MCWCFRKPAGITTKMYSLVLINPPRLAERSATRTVPGPAGLFSPLACYDEHLAPKILQARGDSGYKWLDAQTVEDLGGNQPAGCSCPENRLRNRVRELERSGG